MKLLHANRKKGKSTSVALSTVPSIQSKPSYASMISTSSSLPSTIPIAPISVEDGVPSSKVSNPNPFHPSDDVHFKDLYNRNDPMKEWKSINRKKPSFANMASRNLPTSSLQQSSSRPINPQVQNSNKWVLVFPRNNKPTPGTRLPPLIITEKINRACSDTYHIRTRLAEWTNAGNLTISFTLDSKEANIKNASSTIKNLLVQENPEKVSFSKVVPWSKVIYRGVTCHAVSEEQTDGDATMIKELWSPER